MPTSKDLEPRYGQPGEDGWWPDPDGSIQPEVYGPIPSIVQGQPFEQEVGSVTIGLYETVALPPQLRHVAKVIEQNTNGQFYERPAHAAEIGGGLTTIDVSQIRSEVHRDLHKTHKKSSHKILNLP